MSADIRNIGAGAYAERLATLERRLQEQGSDEALLTDIGVAMRALLADNQPGEAHIRATLQKQFNAGHLRKETFELVQDLLGRIATEELVRSSAPAANSVDNEIFAETAVIEDKDKPPTQRQPQPQAEPPPVTNVELQIGSVLRDRFLLKERVAEGSMGVVYKALDRRLAEAGDDDCYVAIKVLSAALSRSGSALRALQQEATKGRCLAHPNIVRFNDIDREGELYFIVMEWLDGRSLSRILDENRGKALEVDKALGIAAQIADALDYAHQRGVIHADVKPGNVVISPQNEVKLIDFGVARVRQKEQETKTSREPDVKPGGAPAYSSMQVLTGEDPVPTDDVFSLACLFYRMVAGYRVFGPRNAAQAAEEGMEPQQPQVLSNAMWQPLRKALSYSRVTRYASPNEFIAALGGKSGKAAKPNRATRKAAEPDNRVPDIRQSKPAAAAPASPEISSVANGDAEKIAAQTTNELPQPGRNLAAPMRAQTESIMYEPDEDEPRRSFGRLIFLGIFVIAAALLVTRTDFVERLQLALETKDLTPLTAGVSESLSETLGEVLDGEAEFIDAPVVDESALDIAEFVAEDDADTAVTPDAAVSEGNISAAAEETSEQTSDESLDDGVAPESDLIVEEIAPVIEAAPAPVENLIDWSQLPPPTVTVSLAEDGTAALPLNLAVREGQAAAIVDFLRTDSTEELVLELIEADFTGNQSPLESGQYLLENDGLLTFAAGESRARQTISLRSNPVREADREVTLEVSARGSTAPALAAIQLTLEDDDQRAFEQGLSPNTVAFAVNQVSVRESDSAAQIDVVRYKPDASSLEVSYMLTDVTATEGQDYFAPDLSVVYFAPGQRTARILIPLGQDSRPEEDEAFMLQLDSNAAPAEAKLFSQIAVMIRDDDT